MDRVADVGARQGTTFEFDSRPAIAWPEYLSSSSGEQALITADATDGQKTWDAACSAAFQEANPGVTAEPAPSS